MERKAVDEMKKAIFLNKNCQVHPGRNKHINRKTTNTIISTSLTESRIRGGNGEAHDGYKAIFIVAILQEPESQAKLSEINF